MPNHQRTGAIDFDSVIHDNSIAWTDPLVMNKPVEGIKKLLTRLRTAGTKIILHTARIGFEGGDRNNDEVAEALADFMNEHNIPFDEIWMKPGKPVADWYLDDRGVNFDGNNFDPDKMFEQLMNFESWQKPVYE